MGRNPILERWAEVDHLFTSAMDRPASERTGFVHARTQGDPELREVVISLLATTEDGGPSLGRGGAGISAELLADALETLEAERSPAAGRRIGRYRLVREIGRGGTGTVYLAERDDGAFRQQVAVKLLRRGLDTDDILARFRIERQILASMNHPNIARLLDGGATEDGRPYLVMELVEGQSITAYCNDRGLTITDRLHLFATVARAVGYAHANLIVHRDLKPGNILVTDDGQVKLLDFGIAKLLDPALDADGHHTRTGTLLMTPEYASPEQVKGAPITTASDIYQLGMLLYELLSGRRPYHLRNRSRREVEEVVCEREPPPPSTPPASKSARDDSPPPWTGPHRVRGREAGDLDTITLMALRKEPERRYGSVDQLLADLDNYLAGRPVSARPATWRYRTRKLLRRNRGLVAAGLALALAAGAYGVTLTLQADRLAVERDRARVEAAKAEQVSAFLVDLFEASRPGSERTDTLSARTLLTVGADRLRNELHSQPEVRAALLGVVGRIHTSIGLYDQAESLLASSLSLRRDLYGPDHREVAQGLSLLGSNHFAHREFDLAEPVLREAVAIRRRAPDPDPIALAADLALLAKIWRETGQLDSAELLMRESLALRVEAQGEDHSATWAARSELAFILRGKDDLDDAESLYRDVLAHQTANPATDPIALASTQNNLAYLLKVREDYAGAEALYRAALTTSQEILGEAHRTTGITTSNLVAVLVALGRLAEAEALLRQRVEVERRHHPPHHWRIGASLQVLGRFYLDKGDPVIAEVALREAGTVYSEALGVEHPWTLGNRGLVGRSLARQGRVEEAEELLLAALEALRGGDETPQRLEARAAVRAALAELYEGQGRSEQAARFRDFEDM